MSNKKITNLIFNDLGKDIDAILQDISSGVDVSIFSLPKSKQIIVNAKFADIGTAIIVCSDYFEATEVTSQLRSLLGVDNIAYLPHRDDALSTHKSGGHTTDFARLLALSQIAQGTKVIVTTVAALTQKVMSPTALQNACLAIRVGYEIPKNWASELLRLGYTRNTLIEERGQFSKRGDILDVFGVDAEPIRIELFGDTVESIRYFDKETKTSLRSIESVTILPTSEWVGTDDLRQEYIQELHKYTPKYAVADHLIQDLQNNRVDSGLSILFGLLPSAKDHSTVWEFIHHYHQDTPIIVAYTECKKIVDTFDSVLTEHTSRAKSLLLSGNILPQFANLNDTPFDFNHSDTTMGKMVTQVAYHDSLTQNRIFTPQATHNAKPTTLPNYTHDYYALQEDILHWHQSGNQIFVVLDDETKRKSFDQWTKDNGLQNYLQIIPSGLDYGAIFFYAKKVYIGKYDLYKKSFSKKIKRSKQTVFNQPEIGDFVVHSVHGIGRYEGIQKHEFLQGAERDYIVLKYHNDDTLYVPAENMDTLSRFVSATQPQLNRLGGVDFGKVKDRVRQSVKKLAFDLVKLFADRQASKGHKYTIDETLFTEFENRFAYEPTEDQTAAVQDIKKDLQQGIVMDRLLCGDVGYGKTEVAMRAAFAVVLDNHQVAFVSPTTILARQHFYTLMARMQDFGVRIASLTRIESRAKVTETLEKLAQGQIDIVVGTHRVLSKDVQFKNLGLLVLDEEQRFGVGDKEKIKNLKNNINVLSLSATPIPRTLHMSLSGIRSISLLDTPPTNRIPIQTYVAEYTESLVVDAINRELGRRGSVFVVYNRVQSMAHFTAELQQLVPNAKISYANGQMDETVLEDTIMAFTKGETNVLVASTIIENGIDMPNSNTIIIVGSDRLGLAQLYQLRGRVGRSDRQAYAYFTFDDRRVLTETASKRLRAINEFTDLGAGYKLAMRDLEIRGSGNVLGREQHGHMDKVGYDLYCRLLNSAVQDIQSGKESTTSEDIEVKVITDKPAHIPEEYIQDYQSRLNLYGRIARLQNQQDRTQLYKEMVDIYGQPPKPAQNLLLIGLIKNLAAQNNAISVTLTQSQKSLKYNKILDIPPSIQKALKQNKAIYHPTTNTIEYKDVPTMIEQLTAN